MEGSLPGLLCCAAHKARRAYGWPALLPPPALRTWHQNENLHDPPPMNPPPMLPCRRFVVKGWLAAIMQTFEANPRAGLVGPMFMGDNDVITEAGGLVFNDASAANYARGREPHYDVYFMRRTDYVSAACVVFSRDTYDRVGGFDPQVRQHMAVLAMLHGRLLHAGAGQHACRHLLLSSPHLLTSLFEFDRRCLSSST
jgi:hypothetical protein